MNKKPAPAEGQISEQTRHLAGSISHGLLAFVVGERFWVNEDYIAEIVEVSEDRVRLESEDFNGWALKSELKAIPT